MLFWGYGLVGPFLDDVYLLLSWLGLKGSVNNVSVRIPPRNHILCTNLPVESSTLSIGALGDVAVLGWISGENCTWRY